MSFTPFTGTYNAGDLQYVIPTIYGSKVKNIFEAKLLAGKFFTDLSPEIASGGDHISLPDLTSNALTAKDKVTGSNYTEQSPAQGQNTLTVDTWKETSFVIEKRQEKAVLNSYKIMDLYAKNAIYRVAKAFDSSLMGLYSGLSQTQGTADTNLTDSDIRLAISDLQSADVDISECAFFIHPHTFWQDLMGIAKFYESDKAGWRDGNNPVQTGLLPYIYGIPVYLTTQVVSSGGAYYNLLAHPEAFSFAKSLGPQIDSNYIPEQGGTLTTAEVIYGVSELRDDSAVALLANSTDSVAS